MDKYEKKVRVNQIVSCMRNGEFVEAQEIADTIDWRQEKHTRTLRMVSEVYKISRRYEDAFNVLLLAYDKKPEEAIKRKIVYDLCELAIKMNQFGYAVRYMKEFSRLSPKDPGRYILQYRLLKATDADYNERIELLEEFKSRHFGDFDPRWAYELAYLYHLTGNAEKCVECCDETVLWFVTGPFVIKALRLKKEHKPLTYEEEQKIVSYEEGERQEEVLYQKVHRTDTAPVYMDTTPDIGDGFSTGDVEDRVNPVRQRPRAEAEPYDLMPEEPGLNIEVKEVDPSQEPTIKMAEKKSGPSIMARETTILPPIQKSEGAKEFEKQLAAKGIISGTPETAGSGGETTGDNKSADASYASKAVDHTAPIPVDRVLSSTGSMDTAYGAGDAGAAFSGTSVPSGDLRQEPYDPSAVPYMDPSASEISVNVDRFSTMNLQAELRENMEKLQEETGEPLREKEEKLPERVAEPDSDLKELVPGKSDDTRPMKEEPGPAAAASAAAASSAAASGAGSAAGNTASASSAAKRERDPAVGADGVRELTDEEVAARISKVPDTFNKPKDSGPFDQMIDQEMDGQMSFNVPDELPPVEKQITGQMDIESVLAEWDKLQEEARERRLQAAKKKSLEQTNELAKDLVNVIPGFTLPGTEKKDETAAAADTTGEAGSAGKADTAGAASKDTAETAAAETSGTSATAETSEATAQGAGSSQGETPEGAPADTVKEEPAFAFTAELTIPDEDEKDGGSAADHAAETAADSASDDAAEKSAETAHGREPQAAVQTMHSVKPSVTAETIQLPSVFDTFINIKGLPMQLKTVEDGISMDSSHGNVLITGSEKAARMELVQALARDMAEKHPEARLRTALIDADTFSDKDVTRSLKALAGNILVIEQAGHISDDAMHSLLRQLAAEEEKLFVILEDSKGGAKNLAEYPDFSRIFDLSVDIPTLSNDYLVEHARKYARDKEYSLDEMAVLALYQRIDERQTSDHVVTSDEVEKIIDAAIKSSKKKNLKHFGDVLLGKRYDDDDNIVLREKDFA